MSRFASARTTVMLAASLFAAHAGVVFTLGTTAPGPLVSDLIEVVLAGLLVFHCCLASRRSTGLARSFWALASATFAVAFADLSLVACGEFFPAWAAIHWISNLLGCFWFFPLAMAMFLDPDREAEGLDVMVALDFMQAGVFCVAAYLYFFYIPNSSDAATLGHAIWTPYFFAYAFLAGAFWLRSVLTRSTLARSLFRGLALFLVCSDIADVLYRYGPFHGLRSGAWFDLVWNLNLAVPLVLAAAWQQPEVHDFSADGAEREKKIYTEIFYLFFPLLILVMSLRIAQSQLGLAATVILLSFAGSSARLLLTQHRLVKAQDALRWEAARDGLTGLWNRKAVLEILERELLRSERVGLPVGVIMADADHFKSINDSLGHVAGDRVLSIMASEIAAVVRPYDSVGRYGGEEFLVVAPGCGLRETWELAERICVYVRNCSIVAGGQSLSVSLSLGVASGNSAAEAGKLLHDADIALYQAKHNGRNRVEPNLGNEAQRPAQTAPSSKNTFWL